MAIDPDYARMIRLTTDDYNFGLSDEEIAARDESDRTEYERLRRSAGVCDEFPNGEFAVPGFNCSFNKE